MECLRRCGDVRARFERVVGNAAFLGAVAAYGTVLADWLLSRWHPHHAGLPDRVISVIMGTGLGVLFEPLDYLIFRRGYLGLPLVAALLLWRPTRRITLAALSLLFMVETGRVVALACCSLYVMSPTLGLLAAPVAALSALALTWWRRWPVVSIVVLAVGMCIGALLGIIFQHDTPAIVSPLQRFVPTLLLTLLIAWLIARRVTEVPCSNSARFVRMWGLVSLCVSCAMIVGLVSSWLRPRGSVAGRLPAHSSYDVFVTEEPPALLWTDTEDVHVLTDPYGETHDRYVLDRANHRTPQRFWVSAAGGFYMQMQYTVGWWKRPSDGARLSPEPAVEYRHPAWNDGSPGALVEDPLTGAVFIVNQWGSHYAVMDRDSGTTRQQGYLSSALLGAWHSTPVLDSRIAYIASALGDGGMYELDLDSLRITRRAAALHVYEIALDPERRLLWAARPVTGDVIGIDRETFAVVRRFRTGFGSRDLQRDATSGRLYTCSLPGDVYEIDVETETVRNLGWCGRICRNLFLDGPRKTLWAATDDGICRFTLAESPAS